MGVQGIESHGFVDASDEVSEVDGDSPQLEADFIKAVTNQSSFGLSQRGAEELYTHVLSQGGPEAVRDLIKIAMALNGEINLTKADLIGLGLDSQLADKILAGADELIVASNPMGAVFLRLMAVGFSMSNEAKKLFLETALHRKDVALDAAREQFKGAIGQFVMSLASAVLTGGFAAKYATQLSRVRADDSGKGLTDHGRGGYDRVNPWWGPMGAQLFSPALTSSGQFIYESYQLGSNVLNIEKEFYDKNLDSILQLAQQMASMGRH